MKTFLFFIFTLASGGVFAATSSDLDNCTRDLNPQLCMSKVLLSEIQQHSGGGGGGSGTTAGVIRFFHDDGSCNTAVLGQVFVTLDLQQRERVR